MFNFLLVRSKFAITKYHALTKYLMRRFILVLLLSYADVKRLFNKKIKFRRKQETRANSLYIYTLPFFTFSKFVSLKETQGKMIKFTQD